MAKINVMNVIEESLGKINPYYDLKVIDAIVISEFSYNKADSALKGFRFGYIQGMKAAKAEMRKAGVAHV